MKKNTMIYIGAAVVILIVAILMLTRQTTTVDIDLNNEPRDTDQEVNVPLEIISVNHQYVDGVHTIVGALSLPTPCHSYNAVANTTDNLTKINLEIIEPAEDVMCAQVITDVTFRVEFEGSEDQEIIGYLNGNPVILNLFNIPEGENIDDYEVITKG